MTALIAFIVSNPTIVALVGAILGALGWGYSQRRAGAKAERDKRAADRLKARTVADEIDDAVAGREPVRNREELKRW